MMLPSSKQSRGQFLVILVATWNLFGNAQFDDFDIQDPICDRTCPTLKDHFKTLGVESNSTQASLKGVCRKELAANHPDKQIGKVGSPLPQIKA